ncbi:hypothetical protein Tco_0666629 [Tanacetum coccineum]
MIHNELSNSVRNKDSSKGNLGGVVDLTGDEDLLITIEDIGMVNQRVSVSLGGGITTGGKNYRKINIGGSDDNT